MYKKGQSVEGALIEIGDDAENHKTFRPPNSPSLVSICLDEKHAPLRTYQGIQVWRGKILRNGQMLLKELDGLYDEVSSCGDGFSDRKNG